MEQSKTLDNTGLTLLFYFNKEKNNNIINNNDDNHTNNVTILIVNTITINGNNMSLRITEKWQD